MFNIISKWKKCSPYFLSTLRIVTALLFLQVGTAKLFAFPVAVMPGGGTVPFMSLIGVAGLLESVGGLLLLLGLFTRPVAFLLAGEMAFAFFIGHASSGKLLPLVNGGTDAVLYCFTWLYFSTAGAGPISLDAKLNHS